MNKALVLLTAFLISVTIHLMVLWREEKPVTILKYRYEPKLRLAE